MPKNIKKITKVVAPIAAALLAGCQVGSDAETNTQKIHNALIANIADTTPLSARIKAAALNNTSQGSINLAKSLFIEFGGKYKFQLYDIDGKLVESGEFECASPDSCLIDIYSKLKNYTSYDLAIFNETNKFIGGDHLIFDNDNKRIKSSLIDPVSTANYLSSVIRQKANFQADDYYYNAPPKLYQ